MSDKSNKYGYVGPEVTQAFKANKGIFDMAEINNLVGDNKWTQYGQLELIHTENASAVSYVDFLESAGTFDTSYNVHFLTYNDIDCSVDNQSLDIQFYENGTLETSTVYDVAHQYGSPTGFGENKSTTANRIRLSWAIGVDTGENANGYKYLYNLADNTKFSFTSGHWSQIEQPTTSYFFGFGSGVMHQTSTVDGFRLSVSSGNFSGTISLYGIRYS